MSTDRYSRQSFLGSNSEELISRCTIGVVGLGGGGSHIVQQLAHIGFQRYILYDDDVVEESNLNRLIGAGTIDVLAGTQKLHIAKMRIYALQPKASVRGFACKWQENPEPLRECQIVLGCVDSYRAREELEIACRRYLMHYIDIGMDVHGKEQLSIGGQIILSSPGSLCMKCMGFLTDEKLAKEASDYGNAGPRPQVVWPNGVLASTAVGLAVDIVTDWTRSRRPYAYLVYDGNRATVKESPALRNITITTCPHFPESEVGDPVLIGL
ncbi:MAG: ThiF family adenylyltransferase [Syntrophobacteraceae bacterium]